MADKKNSKNNNLILLKSIKEEILKDIILTKEEETLKDQLYLIEDKLCSIEKVIDKIDLERDDTIYTSSAFGMLVGSIAIAAAVSAVSEYFGVDSNDIKKLIEN